MTDFKIHDENRASDPTAKMLLKKAKDAYGFVPNLLGTMAEAPALLKAYMTVGGIFDETSFTPTERQVVLLASSLSNGCTYCMAAHTAIAGMQNVENDVVQALRDDTPIKDRKLESLRRLTQDMTETRGYPSEAIVKEFFDAGYTQSQLLEVVLGISMKTLSNYTNHIAETPLDDAFKAVEWTAVKDR
jgi:uncharacterized peroxidase-related enzyme